MTKVGRCKLQHPLNDNSLDYQNELLLRWSSSCSGLCARTRDKLDIRFSENSPDSGRLGAAPIASFMRSTMTSSSSTFSGSNIDLMSTDLVS